MKQKQITTIGQIVWFPHSGGGDIAPKTLRCVVQAMPVKRKTDDIYYVSVLIDGENRKRDICVGRLCKNQNRSASAW